MKIRLIAAAAAVAAFGIAPPAFAAAGHDHGGPGHKHHQPVADEPEQQPWGIAAPGQPPMRTLTIVMDDTMRFTPSALRVREGDVVRLDLRNKGRLLHELVLGTDEELRKHAALMEKNPGMEHDEAHMVHVRPGGRASLVWNFNRPGTFAFACLVPGHYPAGMTGTLTVDAKEPKP